MCVCVCVCLLQVCVCVACLMTGCLTCVLLLHQFWILFALPCGRQVRPQHSLWGGRPGNDRGKNKSDWCFANRVSTCLAHVAFRRSMP